MSGFVYLVRLANTEVYKVGITHGPVEDRIRGLQTGCPYEIILEAHYEQQHPRLVEQEIHSELETLRVRSEWFRDNGEGRVVTTFHLFNTMACVDSALSDTDLPRSAAAPLPRKARPVLRCSDPFSVDNDLLLLCRQRIADGCSRTRAIREVFGVRGGVRFSYIAQRLTE